MTEAPPREPAAPPSVLRRSSEGRFLMGVCAGLGRHTRIDPVVFRVGFVILLFGSGIGLFLYISAYLLMKEPSGRPGLVEQWTRRDFDADTVMALLTAVLAVGLGINLSTVWLDTGTLVAGLFLAIALLAAHAHGVDLLGLVRSMPERLNRRARPMDLDEPAGPSASRVPPYPSPAPTVTRRSPEFPRTDEEAPPFPAAHREDVAGEKADAPRDSSRDGAATPADGTREDKAGSVGGRTAGEPGAVPLADAGAGAVHASVSPPDASEKDDLTGVAHAGVSSPDAAEADADIPQRDAAEEGGQVGASHAGLPAPDAPGEGDRGEAGRSDETAVLPAAQPAPQEPSAEKTAAADADLRDEADRHAGAGQQPGAGQYAGAGRHGAAGQRPGADDYAGGYARVGDERVRPYGVQEAGETREAYLPQDVGYGEPFAPHGPYQPLDPAKRGGGFSPYDPALYGQPQPPKRQKRPRSFIGALTILLATIIGGILVAVQAASPSGVQPTIIGGAVLVTIGAGLLIAAWWGRGTGLVAAGTMVAVLIGVGLMFGGLPAKVGASVWQPATVAETRQVFDVGVGDGELDLSKLALKPGARVEVRAAVSVGTLEVVVPPEVRLEVHATNKVGDIQLDHSLRGGVDVRVDEVLEPEVAPEGEPATVVLNIRGGVGDVEVRRAA